MGVYSLLALCGVCDKSFTSNPNRVPCFPIDRKRTQGIERLAPGGTKEPVCAECFSDINHLRVEHGLPAQALPAGAYEPADEYDNQD